jgi:hypothetical protein
MWGINLVFANLIVMIYIFKAPLGLCDAILRSLECIKYEFAFPFWP